MTRVRVQKAGGGWTLAAPAAKHPAVFSKPVLDCIVDFIGFEYAGADTGSTQVQVLDPFAGAGRIHEISNRLPFDVVTTGVELEPEWAACHSRTWVGDATALPAEWSDLFDVVATSPCYGNRMADSHNAADKCSKCGGVGVVTVGDGARVSTAASSIVVGEFVECPKCGGSGLSPRRSYTHDLGRKLTPGNSGSMQWGDAYRALHVDAWAEVHRVLRPGGLFLLSIGDHVRNHQRVRVSAWHLKTARSLGFVHEWTYLIPLPGMRYGENNGARIGHEFLYVLRKP